MLIVCFRFFFGLCLLLLSFALCFWWMSSRSWFLYTEFFFLLLGFQWIVVHWLVPGHIIPSWLHKSSNAKLKSPRASCWTHSKQTKLLRKSQVSHVWYEWRIRSKSQHICLQPTANTLSQYTFGPLFNHVETSVTFFDPP
jgi:hypothetical protein